MAKKRNMNSICNPGKMLYHVTGIVILKGDSRTSIDEYTMAESSSKAISNIHYRAVKRYGKYVMMRDVNAVLHVANNLAPVQMSLF